MTEFSSELYPFIRTGRTARMLDAAVAAFNEGKRICIVGACNRSARGFREMFYDKVARHIDRPHPRVWIVASDDSRWSWEDFKYKGLHKETVYFIDNNAIETRYSELLLHLCRFNRSFTPGPDR